MRENWATGGRVEPGAAPLIGDGVCRFPVSDALAAALAAEEHRQGMRYGEDAGHCDGCAAEAQRLDDERLRAECEHDGERVDLTPLGQRDRTVMCVRCGATWGERR